MLWVEEGVIACLSLALSVQNRRSVAKGWQSLIMRGCAVWEYLDLREGETVDEG